MYKKTFLSTNIIDVCEKVLWFSQQFEVLALRSETLDHLQLDQQWFQEVFLEDHEHPTELFIPYAHIFH